MQARWRQSVCEWFSWASVELFELFANVRSGQWRIDAGFLDDLLALAAQHEADELAHLRVHRAARRLVHVDISVSNQRIAAVLDVVGCELDGRAVGSLRQREDLQ